MGGHNAGDIASEMAVLQLGNSWRQSQFKEHEVKSAENWLRYHINKENKRIYDAAAAFHDLKGMGTTLVAAVIFEESTLIANVGDSRAYIFEDLSIKRITEDHSFANELRINGQITEEEAMNHEKKNTLTRSLGVRNELTIDFFYLSNHRKKNLLLCSDGLTNALNESEIEAIMVQENSDLNKVERLVEHALNQGATDNVTVCLIDYATIKTNKEQKLVQEGGSSDENR